MATAADWMSVASFIGVAGTLYLTGYNGLAYILGWTGGYVLVALFLAPYLRKFGRYTIPDFFRGSFWRQLAQTAWGALRGTVFVYLSGRANLRGRDHYHAYDRDLV